MRLRPGPIRPVPEETARVARPAFPKGTTYTRMRDELGAIWEDEGFADLFARGEQPALAPWRLALVTVMQFAEDLPDRRQTPCAPGSTRSMPSASSRPNLASISPS